MVFGFVKIYFYSFLLGFVSDRSLSSLVCNYYDYALYLSACICKYPCKFAWYLSYKNFL